MLQTPCFGLSSLHRSLLTQWMNKSTDDFPGKAGFLGRQSALRISVSTSSCWLALRVWLRMVNLPSLSYQGQILPIQTQCLQSFFITNVRAVKHWAMNSPTQLGMNSEIHTIFESFHDSSQNIYETITVSSLMVGTEFI